MTAITIKGLEELRAKLTAFSDRRFNAAIATAMSRTAVIVRDKMRQQMTQELDRPTPYTLNSLYTVPATAERLQALIRFRDDRSQSNGTPAVYFMGPEVHGGPRRLKGFERALQSMGVLPDGWLAVAGKGAPLDSYGNVSKGYIGQMIRGLAAQRMEGPRRAKDNTRVIAAARNAGGQFFVIRPGGKAQPGIYIRDMIGKNITPVMIFVRGATYRKRLRFYEGGTEAASLHLQQQITRSVQEHIEKLKVKKA